jgi:hypothetical protein
VFTQLVEQTGQRSIAVLRESARQAYELRHDVSSPVDEDYVGIHNKSMADMELLNSPLEPDDDDDDDDDGHDSDSPFLESNI